MEILSKKFTEEISKFISLGYIVDIDKIGSTFSKFLKVVCMTSPNSDEVIALTSKIHYDTVAMIVNSYEFKVYKTTKKDKYLTELKEFSESEFLQV